ncbi:MAG: hypothetical protein ACUVXA_11535 [Candidatus Jordarchaeum sp.]|uniref:hypothetical protein n=1 Tax=Candidatus Jordarchaeum sp. TaxID=2823881 RepID=UPI00404A7F06
MIPSGYMLDSIGLGLWFATISFYLLLFVYLYFFKWRQTKNIFLLSLGVFFICLAIGRIFFMIHDFFLVPTVIPVYGGALHYFVINPWYWRLGSFWEWIALGWLTLGMTMTLLEKRWLQRIIPVIPFIASFVILLVPEDLLFSFELEQLNYFVPQFIFTENPLITYLNFGISSQIPMINGFLYQPSGMVYVTTNYFLAALYALIIPLIFFYVAWQGIGTIRKRALLLGFGFTIYYVGRVLQATLIRTYLPTALSIILAPALAMIALILIYYGIRYEEFD